jgi:hypothetical protein
MEKRERERGGRGIERERERARDMQRGKDVTVPFRGCTSYCVQDCCHMNHGTLVMAVTKKGNSVK